MKLFEWFSQFCNQQEEDENPLEVSAEQKQVRADELYAKEESGVELSDEEIDEQVKLYYELHPEEIWWQDENDKRTPEQIWGKKA